MSRNLTAEDVARYAPIAPRTFFMDPFLPSGFHPETDLYLEYDERLYPVLGRVLKAHPTCTEVKDGDVIVFPPLAYTPLTLDVNLTVMVMDERAVSAILEGYDDEADRLAGEMVA